MMLANDDLIEVTCDIATVPDSVFKDAWINLADRIKRLEYYAVNDHYSNTVDKNKEIMIYRDILSDMNTFLNAAIKEHMEVN